MRTHSRPRFIILDGNTISETDIADPTLRPLKRRRVEEDTSEEFSKRHFSRCSLSRSGDPKHDSQYYTEAGDCVVQVEDTLFKISSALLSECSLELKDSLTQHEKVFGPTSDAQPLCLHTEANVFRVLLRALHEGYDELQSYPNEHMDIDELLSLALITRQYKCTTLGAVTMDTIRATAKRELFLPEEGWSSATFSRMIDVAVEGGDRDLLEHVLSQWVTKIKNQHLPPVPAILVADKYNFPSLAGMAYYQQVQEMISHQTTVTSRNALTFKMDSKLSPQQVTRILTGHWSLVDLWERLRRNPWQLMYNAECDETTHTTCADVWETRWYATAGSREVSAFNSADVLAIIKSMYTLLSADEELLRLAAPRCRRGALDGLQRKWQNLEEDLSAHFLDNSLPVP